MTPTSAPSPDLTEKIIVVYTTHPERSEALKLADTLVKEGLVSCVNVGLEMTSIYQWQGEVHRDPEVPLIMKTVKENFSALERRVVELHPYECPCLLSLTVTGGFSPFLHWIATTTH